MGKKPFIYCFKTPKKCYFYDFNTNAIVRVQQEVYTYLCNWMKTGHRKQTLNELESKVIELKSRGFLSDSHWKKIEHPATKFLNHYLNSSLQSITLQVTQQCNLKCDYCPYSGSFYNREHNNRKMTFDTAKKALDFYIAHSFDLPFMQIGFYGGEPLIEFELIKKLVTYCKNKCLGKPVRFFMTTNGTLLNEEIIDFLMAHNFVLTISLDGPQQYHDRNRHHIDNTGSFETVIRNISKLYSKYPNQKDNVLFNCVIDPNSDIKCINEFFIKEDMLRDYRVLFNTVSRDGIKDEEKFLPGEDYIQQYKFELFKLFYSKSGKVSDIDVSKIVESYFAQIKTSYANRKVTGLTEDYSHPGGPCIPGEHKLFVDVKGNLYPCEKVCECSNDMIIGTIEKGFDDMKVEKLLNIGKLTEEQCKNCWCAKYCFLCSAHMDQGKGLSTDLKLVHCNTAKKSVEEDFKDYCMLQELNGFDDDVLYLPEKEA